MVVLWILVLILLLAERPMAAEGAVPITRYTIYGERCSGTAFLQSLMQLNFPFVSLTWNYGFKHFFGYIDYRFDASTIRMPHGSTYHHVTNSSDDVLFLAIVRNPIQWLASFRLYPYHVDKSLTESWKTFLEGEWKSVYDQDNEHEGFSNKEILSDRHMYTGERYKNIFEMRATKSTYLLDDLPNKVKHVLLVRYEDLLQDPHTTLAHIHCLLRPLTSCNDNNSNSNRGSNSSSNNNNSNNNMNHNNGKSSVAKSSSYITSIKYSPKEANSVPPHFPIAKESAQQQQQTKQTQTKQHVNDKRSIPTVVLEKIVAGLDMDVEQRLGYNNITIFNEQLY